MTTTRPAIWYRRQGDTDDTFSGTADGVNVLAASAVEAHVYRRGEDVGTLAAEVLDPDERTWQASLGDWIDDAAGGMWAVELEFTIDGKPVTWPSRRGQALLFVSVDDG